MTTNASEANGAKQAAHTNRAWTPKPWAVQSQGPDEPVFVIGAEPGNVFIAQMDEGDRKIKEANARLIVLAVNHQDDLIAELEAMTERFEILSDVHGYTRRDEIIERARAAIRAARGE